jgi:hypothetical protein
LVWVNLLIGWLQIQTQEEAQPTFTFHAQALAEK